MNAMQDDESERRWREDKLVYGWSLPPKPSWFLRLPIIRAVRAFWHMWRAQKLAPGWLRVPQYDQWVIYAKRRGWA